VHIPKPLLEAVDPRARALKVSRNKLIVQALEREVTAGAEEVEGIEPPRRGAAAGRGRNSLRNRATASFETTTPPRGAFGLIAATFERAAWTDAVSTAFGEIKALLERKGRRSADFDAAIAAHAIAHAATLVSANVRHMAGVPDLLLEDWLSAR
jgi:hypothetical protein